MTALLDATTDVKIGSGWTTGRRSSWPGNLQAQPLEQLRMSQPLNSQFNLLIWQPKTALWLWQLKMIVTDYYLLKITSDGVTKLKDNFKDPYKNIFKKGDGKYFKFH